jgi:hypothetical protein
MKDDKTLPILVAEFSGIRYLFWSLSFRHGIWSFYFITILFCFYYFFYLVFFEILLRYICAELFGFVHRADLQLFLGISGNFLLVPVLLFFLFMYYGFRKFRKTPKQLFWCENHFKSLNMLGGYNEHLVYKHKVYQESYFVYSEGFFYYDYLEIQGNKLKSKGRFNMRVIDNGVLNALSLKKMIDLDKKYKEGSI